MSQVRTSPLTAAEIIEFYENGFIRPGRVLDDTTLERLRQALDRVRALERQEGREYNLLDPIDDLLKEVQAKGANRGPEDTQGAEPTHVAAREQEGQSVGFLFNLWKLDDVFKKVDFNPVLAKWAAQLIGVPRVRLLEDGAIYKDPEVGGRLHWHQDFPYWPLAQPTQVTAWIALDKVTAENGAMRMAVGSHLLGERLPADTGSGNTFLADKRPAVMQPIQDPEAAGMDVETIELEEGEVSFHHSLTWHASLPNKSSRPRRGFVPRYTADGVIWLGSQRFPYNYTDDEVEMAIGEPLGGQHFPLVLA